MPKILWWSRIEFQTKMTVVAKNKSSKFFSMPFKSGHYPYRYAISFLANPGILYLTNTKCTAVLAYPIPLPCFHVTMQVVLNYPSVPSLPCLSFHFISLSSFDLSLSMLDQGSLLAGFSYNSYQSIFPFFSNIHAPI